MTAPRVSCVCVVHDAAPFAATAIESVLAQDYPRDALELIVVDDGSTDGTSDVLAAYEDRATILRQENAGVCAAAAAAFARVSGEYVGWIDGDDEWLPGRLATQVELLERRRDVGLVFGDLEVIDPTGAVVEPSFWQFEKIQVGRGDVLGRLLHGNFVSGGSFLFRAGHLPLLQPFPTHVRARQDWWVALRIAEVAQLEYIEEPLSRYRLHSRNQCFQAGGDRLARNQCEEIAMRRWVLRHLAHGRAGVADLLACHAGLEGNALLAAGAAGGSAIDCVEPTDSDVAHAEALRSEAAGADPEAAARLLVEALGYDPWNGRARIAAHAAARRLAQDGSLERTARPLEPPLLDGLRSFVLVAFADELAAHPELAAAFAAAYGPDDDATLVVCAPDRDGGDAAAAVMGSFAEAGVADTALPDVLVVAGAAVPAALTRLAGCAHGVLALAEPPTALRELPRVAA